MCTEKMKILNWNGGKVVNKKVIRLLTAVQTGYYPHMSFKKMNHLRLEHFVTQLIDYSTNEYYNRNDIAQSLRPLWWPKYLKFVIPIRKLKGKIGKRDWASTLRSVIVSCSDFYKFNFLNDVIPKEHLMQIHKGGFFNPEISRNNGCWTYRCHENNRAILTRKRTAGIEENCLSISRNGFLPSKFSPVVELSDVAKYPAYLLGTLKIPKVNLIDIVKYPPDLRKVRKKSQLRVKKRKKFLKLPHVRLHELFETPKDVHYSKDDFMNYFNLGKYNVNNNSVPPQRKKAVLSRILRNNNIPISSDLGRYGLQSKSVVSCSMARKTQRLDWFLKEIPEVKSNQEYSVTYPTDQGSELNHHYVFPKRQQYQAHLNLRSYSRLKKCKPLCVRLERVDLNKLKDKYINGLLHV